MLTPMVEVEVIGTKKRKKITALVDTGFSGYLCIPIATARDLGLELCGVQEVQVADGRWINQLEYSGKVLFLGQTQSITIVLTDSDMAQVGTLLLGDCRLVIDFPENKLRITRKKL
jgi:clan AA aspartic protease